MFEIASLIVVNLIIAAIIGFIAGYLIGRPRTAKIDSIEPARYQQKNCFNGSWS